MVLLKRFFDEYSIQKAPLAHVDETPHPRNNEEGLRWCRLLESDDLVYEKYFATLYTLS